LVHNDRVIGGVTPACAERAAVLYTSFVKGDCLFTTARVAETVKLVENSFRDVNIAFANELSMIADVIGVEMGRKDDIHRVGIKPCRCEPGEKARQRGCEAGDGSAVDDGELVPGVDDIGVDRVRCGPAGRKWRAIKAPMLASSAPLNIASAISRNPSEMAVTSIAPILIRLRPTA
jgi:hypothetical protein